MSFTLIGRESIDSTSCMSGWLPRAEFVRVFDPIEQGRRTSGPTVGLRGLGERDAREVKELEESSGTSIEGTPAPRALPFNGRSPRMKKLPSILPVARRRLREGEGQAAAEQHVRPDRWLAFARRGRST